MCGIAGIAGDIEHTLVASTVARMISTLAGRGPDGHGIDVWDRAVLGHRRLSILDLSEAGRQPMLSSDGSIGIVFNGAIYNFRSLRNDLESLGYEFKSQTDTEVLVHGYKEWGIDGLASRIRGMFAFGLWDDNTRKLFLVRDRLGVKPLVFALLNKQIAFASTVRALRLAGFVSEIDEQAVADYLEFGFVTEERTIYEGLLKVPEWEFAASLPFDLRLRGGRFKAVLRELARRKLGERVASGSKRGFTIPVQRWITGRWRAPVEETFRDSLLEKEGWMRSGPALRWLDSSAQTGFAPKQLWYLFVFESWLRNERELARTVSDDTESTVLMTAASNGGSTRT